MAAAKRDIVIETSLCLTAAATERPCGRIEQPAPAGYSALACAGRLADVGLFHLEIE
jgi:hypothetical protein